MLKVCNSMRPMHQEFFIMPKVSLHFVICQCQWNKMVFHSRRKGVSYSYRCIFVAHSACLISKQEVERRGA